MSRVLGEMQQLKYPEHKPPMRHSCQSVLKGARHLLASESIHIPWQKHVQEAGEEFMGSVLESTLLRNWQSDLNGQLSLYVQ